MSANAMLEVQHLSMQFGGVLAVNDFSFEVKTGSITALIGPNGAGKTTAFNCVTGVYEPTNGRIDFDGQTVCESYPRGKMKKLYAGPADSICTRRTVSSPDEIARLGVARTFQNIRLFKSMSVFDNVLVAQHSQSKQNFLEATFRLKKPVEAQMRASTLALLEEQGIAHLKDELAVSLPYGLQRRLEIARALATNPKLLLLDEPAAGMNPQETIELASFIAKIRDVHNLSILVIEHHMDLIMNVCESIYVLDFGRCIAQGTPHEIQGDQNVINAYLGVV